MKEFWRKWSYEIPLAFGDALWEVLVVQFAAFLSRLTLRRVLEFIAIAMLAIAFAQTFPIDLADTELAKPAIATAATLSQTWSGTVRLLNVLPMTPVMLAEYVPADFDAQQRQTSEEALAIVARESGIEPQRISSVVRQGGIYHEILEEAASMHADLIVMTSHRPAMRTYFLGSNAGHVVRYAKCSVLVVRH